MVNCSSLSEGVLESEIFGHVKGAFTGAYFDKPGRFELADKGTMFLDEIGEMSLPTQVKLLRVLEHGEFERVGANQTIKVDVRIVAATNRNLIQAVKEGTFREDLFYRIRVIPIQLPPLRERMEDLPFLINHFIEKFNRVMAKEVRQVTSECLAALERYDFPGNIRELQNIIEHAFVCCESHVIQFNHLPPDIQRHGGSSSRDDSLESLEEIEGEVIQQVLQKTGWRFNEASKRLGVSRSTLWRKIKHLGIPSNGRNNDNSRKS